MAASGHCSAEEAFLRGQLDGMANAFMKIWYAACIDNQTDIDLV